MIKQLKVNAKPDVRTRSEVASRSTGSGAFLPSLALGASSTALHRVHGSVAGSSLDVSCPSGSTTYPAVDLQASLRQTKSSLRHPSIFAHRTTNDLPTDTTLSLSKLSSRTSCHILKLGRRSFLGSPSSSFFAGKASAVFRCSHGPGFDQLQGSNCVCEAQESCASTSANLRTGSLLLNSLVSNCTNISAGLASLLVVLRKKMNSYHQQSALFSQPVLHQSVSVPFRRTSAGFSLKWLSRQVRVIWRKYKLRKVMPMLAMFLLILFGYNVLRDIKDALIVTAAGSGAETIPFLKTWVVVPAAAAVMVLYTKLSDKLDRESLFYASISPFLAFFSLFAFVMYPLRSYLHPHALAETLRAVLPLGFGGPIAIFEYWTYSLFYVMAELWGSVVLTMGFWTFANEITHVDEASSLYPVLGIAGNVPALFFSGGIVKYFSKLRQTLPPGVDKWGLTLKYLMGLVVLAGLAVCGIFYWMNRNVVPASMNAQRQEESGATLSQPKATAEKKEKKKKTMTFMDGVRFLAGSSYLRNLAVLVVGYGVSINLVEIMWKAKAKEAFPNPSDYSAFMGDVSMMTGVGTLATMAISHPVLTKLGWGAGAVTTPLVMLASGAAFLSLILFPGYFGGVAVAMKTSPLLLAVWIGTVQQIFGKAAKYTLFDPTKEMVYIALDKESKSKGKAAVDVMGHLVGKSGGAFLQQICLLACGSLAASAPSVSLIFVATIVAWLMAVNSLDVAVKPLFAKRNVEPTHQQPAAIPVYASSSTIGSKSTVVPFSRSVNRQQSASDKNIDAVRRALDKVYQRSNRVERAMETAAGQSADADVRRDAVVALLEASYTGERLLHSGPRHGQSPSDPSRQSPSRASRRWKRVHVNSKLTSARLNRYQVFSDDEMCVRCNASGLLVRQNFDNSLDSSKIRSLSSAFHTAICPVCRGTGKDWTAVSAFYCVG